MPKSLAPDAFNDFRQAQLVCGNWLPPGYLWRRREVLEETVYDPVADPLRVINILPVL